MQAPAPVSAPQVGQPRAVEGFQQSKLDDASHQTAKYVAGRVLQAGGGVDQILATPQYAGWTKVSGDKIRSPQGSIYDTSRDFTGANGQPGADVGQFQYISGGPAGPRNDGIRGNDPHGGNYVGPQGSGPAPNKAMLNDGIKGNYAAAQNGGGLQAGSAGGGSFQDQTRALLMQQLQQSSQPISANDPQIAGELEAQKRLIDRNRQDRRAAGAERMAAEGLNSGGAGSGAMDSEIASGFEDAGQQKTAIQSQLFGRELQNRRAQMSQLLQMALQSGDQEQARQLQLQMQQIDNQLRKSQWDDSYGLQTQDAQYQRDRDAARAKSGLPF